MSSLSSIHTFAHSSMLNVSYSNCIHNDRGDGVNETWYMLNTDESCYHYSHNAITIKYYFATEDENGYTWTTDVSSVIANEIKTAFANSMKKWNNVYFYSYDSSGHIVKNKIINIVEGTATDHNIIIYPVKTSGIIGATGPLFPVEIFETNDGVTHKHYSNWYINVNLPNFYINETNNATYVNSVRERNGAHEFGHVLGLCDTDSWCSAADQTNHHHELLMGYGEPTEGRSLDITYKDIAGAAITRGFHTDNDHKWLNCGIQSDGAYKLICSICNGVKHVSSLSGYSYKQYGYCDNRHYLSSGNMMAVASYGTKDYYKCEYCSYVAPFSSIVPQNYTVTYTNTTHTYTNNVQGLNYTIQEVHTLTSNGCYACGYNHTHSYGTYVYSNNRLHIRYCICGSGETESHYIRQSDIVSNRYATCLGCNTLLDLNEDMANIQPNSITLVTVNGSYILPNGIVVLVDEDVEAYINGTLQFYNSNSVPETD